MYRAHCSLVGTVQPCKYNIGAILGTLKFQSLIGTVQWKRKTSDRKESWTAFDVSISHRYGSTKQRTLFRKRLSIKFQSLIGTVQQPYLLRFLFSLYPIFPVFQPFSPKKSINLFIANSRKALILLAFLFLSKLARRFTDFSAVFWLFSALFHAVFVLEALILLPWRFTDFFTEFLAISCLNVQL